MKPIPVLVDRLIEQSGGNSAAAAKRLGSTTASLSRYRTGEARPRANVEQRLRDLVESTGDLVDRAESSVSDQRLLRLEQAISSTLNSLREEFHRSATISTRQEVLDLVAVLVFAHVTSIDAGGRGIGVHLLSEGKAATVALNDFVAKAILSHLPDRKGHCIDRSRFFVPLNAGDENFATAILNIFEGDSSFRELHQAGRDDLINDVFSRFMATSFVDEKEMGQYLTPPEVTRFMVEVGFHALAPKQQCRLLAPDNDGKGIILDPSCGVGSFLAEAIRHLHEKVRQRTPDSAASWLQSFIASRVVGLDKSERMLRLANINLGLFGVSNSRLYLANSLARAGTDAEVTLPLEHKAQIILTNPPFGATYSSEELHTYALFRSRKRVDSELLFLERYVEWLAPDGVIVSIVPDSVLVNKGVFSDLRTLLRNRCDVVAVISLPSVTFAAAGTTTKTSILVLRKRGKASKDAPTFFGEAREIGYDVVTRSGQRRRVRHARNDLPALLVAFKDPNKQGWTALPQEAERWDAPFHAAPTNNSADNAPRLKVSALADLVDQRNDPKHIGGGEFKYIEIGDIDGRTGFVGHKVLPTHEAPSRARKVVRTGDVLVSTVRPERGTIGVVPSNLDGAICSTGFAVLRCREIHPVALSWLLRTEDVKAQMTRHNVGIAYPAITEDTCLALELRLSQTTLRDLSEAAKELEAAQKLAESARQKMMHILSSREATLAAKPHLSRQTKSRRQSNTKDSDLRGQEISLHEGARGPSHRAAPTAQKRSRKSRPFAKIG